MSVATDSGAQTTTTETTESPSGFDSESIENARRRGLGMLTTMGVIEEDTAQAAIDAHDPDTDYDGEVHEMGQMGAKRIGSLAIGIGVVGIVLNEMSSMEMVNQSDGVVDVSQIFNTAGSGLSLLVLGVIIAAAAVLLNLWSGF